MVLCEKCQGLIEPQKVLKQPTAPPPREQWKAVCSQCGRDTLVPFKPNNLRPIFCKDCYMMRKAQW